MELGLGLGRFRHKVQERSRSADVLNLADGFRKSDALSAEFDCKDVKADCVAVAISPAPNTPYCRRISIEDTSDRKSLSYLANVDSFGRATAKVTVTISFFRRNTHCS